MKSRTWTLILSLLVVLFVATSTVYAAPIRVDCGRGGSINSTLANLASAGNTRGITIFVTGTCRENVVISAFDHLTLQASPIATIQDQSNGTVPLFEIVNSYDVTVMGFTLNGGSAGVGCDADSNCTLYLNSIQQAAAIGVPFRNSNGQISSNNISNNAGKGIAIYSSSVSQSQMRSAETSKLAWRWVTKAI
jgi:parallel beta-helix repeat protein